MEHQQLVPASATPSVATVNESRAQASIARMQRRAPWIPDTGSTQCMLCAENFSLTCRRHHCRSCGLLVCNDCSKERSEEVPGYERDYVRICRGCFLKHYAVLVVWHSWFSFKDKLVSGTDEGRKAYEKLPSSASKIALRMADGCVLYSWFKNESWQTRIINRVQAIRRELLSVPSMVPPRGSTEWQQTEVNRDSGSPNQLPVPSVMNQGGGNTFNNRIPPDVAPIEEPNNQARVTSMPRSSTQPTSSTYLNCFIVYRRNVDDPLIHAWIDVRSEPDLPEILGVVKGIVDRSEVVQAAMVGPDLRVHFVLDKSRETDVPFAEEAQAACKNARVIIAWQSMEGPQMTRLVAFGELPAAMSRLDHRLPSVVLDSNGDVLSYRNCSLSTLDVLCRTAGSAVLSHLKLSVLAVSSLSDPNSVRLFNNAYVAHKEIRDAEDALLFSHSTDGTVALVSAHPSVNLREALELIAPNIVKAIGSAQKVKATSAVVEEEVRQNDTLNCPICLERYTTEARRPCICGNCGNTICFGCISSLRTCPYCRHEFPAGRPPTNVALIGMLENPSSPSTPMSTKSHQSN